ncbi:serine hydroxymethyltransferase cytosolic (glycine hydroxymethyltransferase) [Gracilaria domingensis]|nr:serine hydroxymethyltransferase cytosolic (glycine hydroxymethyltransferase) [Gracilaria domingensis]
MGEQGEHGCVPRLPGRAAQQHDWRAGSGVEGSDDAGVQAVLQAGARQRARARRAAGGDGLLAGDGRHGEPPDSVGPAPAGRGRLQGGEGVRSGAHHAEQERGGRRHVGAEPRWDPHWRAGHDVARAGGGAL